LAAAGRRQGESRFRAIPASDEAHVLDCCPTTATLGEVDNFNVVHGAVRTVGPARVCIATKEVALNKRVIRLLYKYAYMNVCKQNMS
jgi:hypothetical protein